MNYTLKLLLSLLLLLPLCLAYREGAQSDSCYGHEIDHSIPLFPPLSKTDCTEPCRFDLILLGKVNPITLEVIDANVDFF